VVRPNKANVILSYALRLSKGEANLPAILALEWQAGDLLD
jgi:hypothetical protein